MGFINGAETHRLQMGASRALGVNLRPAAGAKVEGEGVAAGGCPRRGSERPLYLHLFGLEDCIIAWPAEGKLLTLAAPALACGDRLSDDGD